MSFNVVLDVRFDRFDVHTIFVHGMENLLFDCMTNSLDILLWLLVVDFEGLRKVVDVV